MGFWKILQPEGIDVTNLVANPSIEEAVTGYVAILGTIARSTAKSRRGAASLAISPSTDVSYGAYYDAVALISGQDYNFSLDVWGPNTIPYLAYFADTNGVLKGTETNFTGNDDWQRINVQWQSDTTANIRLYVKTSSSTDDFYVDGLQVTQTDHETSYIDGDQDDGEWNGAAHASTSTRDGQARAGGEEIDLEGLGVYVNVFSGIGMPPAKHHTLSQALLPGAKFLGRKVLPRTVTLNSDAQGTSHANMHAVRQALIDLIKPDLVKDDQPFTLRYYGADTDNPLDLHCVYDSGLDFVNLDGFTEKPPVRLIAYDPFWYEQGNVAAALATSASDTDAAYNLARLSGLWQGLGTGMNEAVYALARGPDGSIYAGGLFTTADGDTDSAYISRWDGSAWQNLSTGLSSSVTAIAIGPDGSVYIGGAFSNAGGDANADFIAKWNGSAFSALGTGMDSSVRALLVASDGKLYAAGNFTTAGGDTDCAYVAYWDGSAWQQMGTAAQGLNDSAYALCEASDGSIYVAGLFTTVGGDTDGAYIAKWDPSTATWSQLGSGLDASARCLLAHPDGRIFIGGSFTAAGGDTDISYLAAWNGFTYEAFGTGPNGAVYSLAREANGQLWVGGNFTAAGGLSLADRVALWNGSTWAHADVDLPGAPIVYAIFIAPNGDIYLGYGTTGTATISAQTTVTNGGTLTTYPVFRIKRSGGTSATLEYLRNETTGATLWLNYALLDGETLTIDFRPEKRSIVSSFFGPVWRAVLRNSDFAEFNLLPGANIITCFVNPAGSPTLTCDLQWQNVHWSADGA